MSNNAPTNDLVFEVLTPLEFTVRVTRSYWELIVTIKSLVSVIQCVYHVGHENVRVVIKMNLLSQRLPAACLPAGRQADSFNSEGSQLQ